MAISSEEVEPVMARIMGEMFLRCANAQKSGDRYALEDACANMWWAVRGINKLAVALCKGEECVHFSIVSMNNTRHAREYIMMVSGIDPDKQPGWN